MSRGRMLWGKGGMMAMSLVSLGVAFGMGTQLSRETVVGTGPYTKVTQDMTPIELVIEGPKGTTNFSIPKAYLSEAKQWAGGVQWRVYLETADVIKPLSIYSDELYARLLVEFGTISEGNISTFRDRYNKEYFQNWITITLAYGHGYVSTKETIPSSIKKTGKYVGKSIDEVFHRYDVFHGGVDVKPYLWDIYYVPVQQEPIPIYIRCPDPSRSKNADLVRCTAYSDFNEVVSYNFTFQLHRLNTIKQLNEKVRSLIETVVSR